MEAHDGMTCMNCHVRITSLAAKLWQAVLVCDNCHALATSSCARIEMDLKRLLVLAQDRVRVALVEGKLHPTHDPQAQRDLTYKSVVDALMSRTGSDIRSTPEEVPANET